MNNQKKADVTPTISEKFIFLKEMAQLLGTTEGSLRGHIHRQSSACPPDHTKIGKKIAWRREDYVEWVKSL